MLKKCFNHRDSLHLLLDVNKDIAALKVHLQPIIEIPPAMMKVMIKGLAKDKDTLAQLGVNKTSKVNAARAYLKNLLQYH